MKVWSTLALLTGLSTAASILTPDSVKAVLERREVRRPYNFGDSGVTPALVPEDAPADYHTAVGSLTENQSASTQKLKLREISRKARDTMAANDFFECATSGTPPRASDCNTVINNVIASNQATVIAPGACLLFQFSTCWGFFCSLCQQLGTDTDFIGSQLKTAQTLCVNGGSAGTVVGEDAPQWEAGFIRANGQLPNYAGDVC
ncbi:hypothetical protein E0Z10_g3384 [Xylaria hypoxylon]|uniref:Ecp2 effector protein domain-containing protein n=1 Tax=Xylaria hypoxylon TaxID=37992 RepID=A0A4Z0Z3L9_9PEZI|nr:hypothetical protein E0Z10_g3384 [Xylaria hypoxylon]